MQQHFLDEDTIDNISVSDFCTRITNLLLEHLDVTFELAVTGQCACMRIT